ncbi:MAG: type II secretion system F family protein [Vulcanimicrobiota bacterium]
MAKSFVARQSELQMDRDKERERAKKLRVPAKNLVIFIRQLSIMLRSGIPVTYALDTLSNQPESQVLGQVVARLSQMLGEGHKLSHAMAYFPGIFDQVFISMVAIGEESGQLDVTLDRLASWRERDYELVRMVKGALSYPCFILALTGTLTFFLFYSILPNFLNIFEEMKVPTPVITKITMGITQAAQNPGVWLIATAVSVAIYGLFREQWKTEEGRIRIFTAVHEIPVAGHLVRLTTISRFAGAIETLLDSGLGLQKTLRLGGMSSGSPIVQKASEDLVERVKDGEQLSEYIMMRVDLFPGSFAQYVATGEETSQVSRMMGHAARMLDEEVSYKVEALGATLEPFLLGMVAGIVGFVLLSIFIPLYSHIGS